MLPCNKFSYVDDLTTVAPSALPLYMMLNVYSELKSQSEFEMSTRKTMVLLNATPGKTIQRRPNVFLNRQLLTYVKDFKYLGHVLTEVFIVKDKIEHERRSLTV